MAKIQNEAIWAALEELKRRLKARFPRVRLILFGSAVRGEMDEESDIDVLILTERLLSREERNAIVKEVFEINLRYETNISVLLVDARSWKEGPISAMPIHQEIEKEGVEL